MPYQSPSRCSLGRISWKGVSAMERVPAGRLRIVLGRRRKPSNRGSPGSRQSTHIWAIGRACTSICFRFSFLLSKRAFPEVEELRRLFFCQRRNPPTNALALSPARQPGGSSFSFLTFPPPKTTSSGSRAAMRRATTSATCLPPFLFAQPFESADADIIFEGAFFVRQMAKLHGFHDAVHDHGGTETGPKPRKSIFPPLVAPESLHRGVVHDFDRTLKRGFEVESYPPASEVMRFRKRSIVDDRPGIADRYCVILPIAGELLDTGDHLFGSQRGPGWKFPRLLFVR